MSRKLASRARIVGRRLTYAYAAAGLVLLVVLAFRADAFEGWMWGSLMILIPLVVSFRSALVYAYRKVPSKLDFWIRPTPGVAGGTPAAWLVSAVVFGAASVLVLLL